MRGWGKSFTLAVELLQNQFESNDATDHHHCNKRTIC